MTGEVKNEDMQQAKKTLREKKKCKHLKLLMKKTRDTRGPKYRERTTDKRRDAHWDCSALHTQHCDQRGDLSFMWTKGLLLRHPHLQSWLTNPSGESQPGTLLPSPLWVIALDSSLGRPGTPIHVRRERRLPHCAGSSCHHRAALS